jgi:hypothetical protein
LAYSRAVPSKYALSPAVNTTASDIRSMSVAVASALAALSVVAQSAMSPAPTKVIGGEGVGIGCGFGQGGFGQGFGVGLIGVEFPPAHAAASSGISRSVSTRDDIFMPA